MELELSQPLSFDSLLCLTGFRTDKQLQTNYALNIATIRHWKNKTLKAEDSWRRVIYEFFIRYVPEKDFWEAGETEQELEVDLKRNITILELGESNYYSLQCSKKEYKRFIAEMLATTPTKILRQRIEFLKECIDSRQQIDTKR